MLQVSTAPFCYVVPLGSFRSMPARVVAPGAKLVTLPCPAPAISSETPVGMSVVALMKPKVPTQTKIVKVHAVHRALTMHGDVYGSHERHQRVEHV